MQVAEINMILINMDVKDVQARVIECESWDKYVAYFTEYNGEAVGNYVSVNGNLKGFVLPKMAKIYDLEYDDHKLTCTVNQTKKISCVVQ